MKEHGKKLSKREGDASFEDFYNKGYLKEAILDYVARWAGAGMKRSSAEKLVTFDIKNQQISGYFDINKLRWMNGIYQETGSGGFP